MRPEKQLLLDEINEKIEKSEALFVVSYKQLSPYLYWDFSEQLAKKKNHFEVVKKRVFFKAIEKNGLGFDKGAFAGHIGILFVQDDAIDALKLACEFSSSHADIFNIFTGYFEGKVYSSEEVMQLSKLPGKDEMRGQFLGLLEAPMSQNLSVMHNLLTSIMHCLENKVIQKESK